MADQAEGRQALGVLIEEATFGTIEPAVVAGTALPYTSLDLNPGEGFTDFEEIDALSVPSKPMGARHQPSGTWELPLHYDSWSLPLKYAIGLPVTTGAADPWEHVYTLGSALPPGLEVERQQQDLTKKSRRFWAGRVSSMDFAMELEGAVSMTLNLGFQRYEPWALTPAVTTPSGYTSDPVDSLIGKILIGGVAVGYVAAFNFTLDWQLDMDKFPVGNEGWRSSLSRGKPTLQGSIDVFLNNDSMTELIDAAEATPPTPVSFECVFETTSVARSISFAISNAQLRITGEPVPDTMGLNAQFDWRASGAGCLVATLYNDVAVV